MIRRSSSLYLPSGKLWTPPVAAHKFGAATSDCVEVASAASMNNVHTFTYIWWMFPTTFTSLRTPGFRKAAAIKAAVYNGTSGLMDLNVNRATTNATVTTATTLTLNRWYKLAFTYGSTNGIKMYYSDGRSPMIEMAYTSPVVGSGAESDDTGTLHIGCNSAHNRAFQGSIGLFQLFAYELTLAELNNPAVLAAMPKRIDLNLGQHGLGTQIDYSGNGNHATPSGISLDRPAPPAFFYPRSRRRHSINVAAAASTVPAKQFSYRLRRVN